MSKLLCIWICLAVVYTISCGSSKQVISNEDRELALLLGTTDYASLTSTDKYDLGEYLMRRGSTDKGRQVFEDVLTHNPKMTFLKYKLALIYLDKDTVRFTTRDEKGNVSSIIKNGHELGEAVLKEIAEEDPSFLPVYTELILLMISHKDTAGAGSLYDKAMTLDKNFSAADYRVGIVAMKSTTNANALVDAQSYFSKAQQTYHDLFESYKNLANIQKVQNQDSVAYKSYLKSLEYRCEAGDLYSAYFEFADVCSELYGQRKEDRYKDSALVYACRSLNCFPSYTPSLILIHELTGPRTAADSLLDPLKLEAPANAYCSSIGESKITSTSGGKESVIPKSILTETFPKPTRKKK